MCAATRIRPVPRLSIIIPCLGGAAEFDGTLVSVLQNRPADCEVLVALGGFETAFGDELADVAIALAIQSLGRLHVAEPASQLLHRSAPTQSPPAGFVTARSAERLFCRSAAAHGWTAALALHAFT